MLAAKACPAPATHSISRSGSGSKLTTLGPWLTPAPTNRCSRSQGMSTSRLAGLDSEENTPNPQTAAPSAPCSAPAHTGPATPPAPSRRFSHFMNEVLQLRGSNTATVKACARAARVRARPGGGVREQRSSNRRRRDVHPGGPDPQP